MPKPMFHMSNKAFHPCTTVKGTLFLSEIPRLKLIVLCSIRNFELQKHTGAVLGKSWAVSVIEPYAQSWIVTSSFIRKIAHKCVPRVSTMSFNSRLYLDRDSWILHTSMSLLSFASEGSSCHLLKISLLYVNSLELKSNGYTLFVFLVHFKHI